MSFPCLSSGLPFSRFPGFPLFLLLSGMCYWVEIQKCRERTDLLRNSNSEKPGVPSRSYHVRIAFSLHWARPHCLRNCATRPDGLPPLFGASAMLCLRCIRAALVPPGTTIPAVGFQARQLVLRQQQRRYSTLHAKDIHIHTTSADLRDLILTASRPLSLLTQLSRRPAAPRRPALPISDDIPASSLRPLSQPSLPLLQVRGAKRDTYNPSHRVRKRRHGFLARLRSRTGRKILRRRRAKGRNTMSH